MKRLLVVIGLWIARLGGWQEAKPAIDFMGIPGNVIESARNITAQTEKMQGGGEYKRREALRALMNRHPDTDVKDLALAIELVIR